MGERTDRQTYMWRELIGFGGMLINRDLLHNSSQVSVYQKYM